MKELMEKLDEQNITVADYGVMSKVIEAALQRGVIRANEPLLLENYTKKYNFK